MTPSMITTISLFLLTENRVVVSMRRKSKQQKATHSGKNEFRFFVRSVVGPFPHFFFKPTKPLVTPTLLYFFSFVVQFYKQTRMMRNG